MLKKIHLFSIAALILLLFSEMFASGGKRNGTAGAQELLIPTSARGIALGSANLATIHSLDAIYYNPAGVGVSENTAEAMFSYMSYIADIGYTFAAVSVNFESFGTLGFSFRSLDFGDIAVTNERNPYGTGSTFSPTFVVLTLTYANALTDRIRVGANINLITEKIMSTGASGVSVDAGIQYTNVAGVEGLDLGISLKNLGPQMSYDGSDLLRKAQENIDASKRGTQFYKISAASFELPSQLFLGLSYTNHFSDLYSTTISTAFVNNNFANDEYNFSLEFDYDNLVYLRGGYSFVNEGLDVEEESLFGPTFGAGFKIKGDMNVTFDYGYRWARYFDANHILSVKVGF